MKCYKEAAIEVALGNLNYLEKASNAHLDDFTKNAGHNNFTKFSRDLDNIPGFYNLPKNGHAPWCAIHNDWVPVTAFGVENAKKITFHSIYGASCTVSANQYEAHGRLYYKQPELGDEAFFPDGKGGFCHTGLVVAKNKTTVCIVEGNTSSEKGVVANGGAVCKKPYAIDADIWYGRPLYDPSPKKKYQGTFPSVKVTYYKTTSKGKKVKKNRYYLKQGDTGTQVKRLQEFLNWFGGYDLDVDGEYGPKTAKAVAEFRKKTKLTKTKLAKIDTFGKGCLAKAKTIKK